LSEEFWYVILCVQSGECFLVLNLVDLSIKVDILDLLQLAGGVLAGKFKYDDLSEEGSKHDGRYFIESSFKKTLENVVLCVVLYMYMQYLFVFARRDCRRTPAIPKH
jgi:hypothetical protein